MTKNALRNRVNRDIMEERRTLPNIREQLAENILSLTDEQAAYGFGTVHPENEERKGECGR